MNGYTNLPHRITGETVWTIAVMALFFLFFARFVAFLAMIVWGLIQNAF